MVDIESKRGHKVSVLLTPDIKGAMDILVKKRQEANINTNNKFFFARPSEDSLNHIRHWDCLRKQCTGLKLALLDEGNISQAIGKSLNDIDVLGGKKEQI